MQQATEAVAGMRLSVAAIFTARIVLLRLVIE
jgi:hypothetical protein